MICLHSGNGVQLSKSRKLASQSQRQKILVVDDAPDMRLLVCEALKAIGFQADCASDGKEALAYLRTHELPELIILDLHMPVMDGREFYHCQKNDERLQSIPVLLYTSAPEWETEFCPRSECLSKGASIIQLVSRVQSLLNQKDTVLIVDDHRDLLCCLRIFLENAGFEVIQASNAQDALEYLKSEKIDAVITDLEMPGMNGLELIRCVRSSYPKITVALMSGWTGIGSEKLELAGADAFFSKPVEMADLVAFLRTSRH